MNSHYSDPSMAGPVMHRRFRGFLPVIVDVETGGFDPETNPLLEVALVLVRMDGAGLLYPGRSLSHHVAPFPDAVIEPEAIEFNGIDPHHPLRMALPEGEALRELFEPVRQAVKKTGCTRAILVGHNAAFDLSFINAAARRAGIKRNPFHPFSTLDTVSLSALIYGQTVLAKAAKAAGMDWNGKEAHAALYDAEKTAELFCRIHNTWQQQAAEHPWMV